jgi:hydrogenase nickel incorporation protein HypA/HybF
MEIIEIAQARAEGARVTKVVVAVGKLSAVLPDALRFSFEVAAQGTALEGATLEIDEVAGAGRCRACGASVALSRPFGTCACGGIDLELTQGEELHVKALEVQPCA